MALLHSASPLMETAVNMEPSLGAVCAMPFEYPLYGKDTKADRAHPEAAQGEATRCAHRALTVALGMWHVSQGVLYSGTQSGIAEVTHLAEASAGQDLISHLWQTPPALTLPPHNLLKAHHPVCRALCVAL